MHVNVVTEVRIVAFQYKLNVNLIVLQTLIFMACFICCVNQSKLGIMTLLLCGSL